MKKINIVIYARYSSHKQSEQSIDGQLRYCRDYAIRNNMRIIHEYLEPETSAKNDKRPIFQQMIKDSQKGLFQYILVWKLDRFSRNRFDAAVYKKKLQENNVRVISATESVGTGKGSNIIEAVYEAMAQEYLESLSSNVIRGMWENAYKAEYTGGHVAYGFKIVNKQYVIDEGTAPTIKYIFERFAAGDGITEIIRQLTAKHIYKKSGKPFTVSALEIILRNQKYIGTYIYNGYKETEYGRIKQKHIIENAIPAIVDKQTFEKAQQRLDINKRTRGKSMSNIDYLLSGKLYCGYCGALLTGESCKSQNGKKHYYYSCKNRKRTKTCIKKRENKEQLEQFIIDSTLKYVLSEDKLNIIADELIKKLKEDENAENRKKFINKKLSELNKELDNSVELLLHNPAPALLERINKRSEDIQLQINELTEELQRLELSSNVNVSKDDIKNWIENFCAEKEMETIIKTFVNSIFVWEDKILIYYNIDTNEPVKYDVALNDIKKRTTQNSSSSSSMAPPTGLEPVTS